MSTFDDDIEFDFFDEPETVEATQRGRRIPRLELPGGRGGGGPRRPPMRVVPLARLVGLIAIAIAVVLGLVFWVDSCQGKSKHDEYASYVTKVRTIANGSSTLGKELASKLISPGLKQADLRTSLAQYAQQEQQAYDEAQQIRAPGPLRDIHHRLVDALELRAKGLAGLADVASQEAGRKNAPAAASKLTAQAQLLTASDVVWEELYRKPAKQQLSSQGVTGVVVPGSRFVSNPDLVSARSFGLLLQRLQGASTGGTPSGKHGDALVSVRALPQGVDLSTTTPVTVKVSAELSFTATVEDSGNFQEVNVPVTLTIDAGAPKPIVRRKAIQLVQPGKRATVTFSNFDLPNSAFGAKATVKVDVGAVAGEIITSNNSATYSVYFTLSGP
ncbi:MAG: hypothetical protein V7644_1188 [Actinomycetota bacterium]|jgi:hypothetical protein